MRLSEYWPHLVGAVLGLAVSAYVLVYTPMMANYERGGCVWLVCEGGEQP